MMEWVKINLSDKELSELKNAESEEKNARNIKKIICIRLKNSWKKHSEVSDILDICFDTISRWLKTYKKSGLSWLLESNYHWKPARLSDKDNEKIKERNTKKPFECLKEAKDFISKEFWIKFWLTNTWKILKKNSIYLAKR